jgi:hypothetical protein
MTFDILFGVGNKVIGMATTLIDNPKEVAGALGKPEENIYHGRYKVLKGRFIKSLDGQPYTYWSTIGPIDMAEIVEMSGVDGMKAYYFKEGDGVVAFLDLEDAVEGGCSMENFVGEEHLPTVLLRDAFGFPDKFTKAVAVALNLDS